MEVLWSIAKCCCDDQPVYREVAFIFEWGTYRADGVGTVSSTTLPFIGAFQWGKEVVNSIVPPGTVAPFSAHARGYLSIPQGATILSAKLPLGANAGGILGIPIVTYNQLNSNNFPVSPQIPVGRYVAAADVHFEAIDSADPTPQQASAMVALDRTVAYTEYDIGYEAIGSVNGVLYDYTGTEVLPVADLTAQLQEVVNRPGWTIASFFRLLFDCSLSRSNVGTMPSDNEPVAALGQTSFVKNGLVVRPEVEVYRQ